MASFPEALPHKTFTKISKFYEKTYQKSTANAYIGKLFFAVSNISWSSVRSDHRMIALCVINCYGILIVYCTHVGFIS